MAKLKTSLIVTDFTSREKIKPLHLIESIGNQLYLFMEPFAFSFTLNTQLELIAFLLDPRGIRS